MFGPHRQYLRMLVAAAFALLLPAGPAEAVLPSLSIGDVSLAEGDSGTTAFVFPVTLNNPSGVTVTVHFTTQDGTATAPTDYLATSGTLTFAPGETAKTITIFVIGDLDSEPDETFTVVLSNPTNASIVKGTGLGTILDDDVLPGLAISDASVVEGQSGTTTMTFNVTLSRVSGQDVSVDYQTADGTATVADGDYVSTTGTLFFAANVDTAKSFTVTVNGDTKIEGDETLFVNLSNADPFKVKVVRAQGTGVIVNDDGVPGVPTDYQSKLVANDSTTAAKFGSSVGISADGNAALVGGQDDIPAGAAWIFRRTGYKWAQEGSKLTPNDAIGAAKFGVAAALSGDGNTAAMGGSQDNGGVGAAWIFTRNGATWTQQGSKVIANNALGSSAVGAAVALSSDGNTLLAGGPLDNNVGAAWVFVRSGNAWTQQQKLTIPGLTTGANFGAAVALSADGNTALVGAPLENGASGGAWVFTRSGGTWSLQGDRLLGASAAAQARQGQSVALSADGNTALIGGPTSVGNGQFWTFGRVAGTWSQDDGPRSGAGAVGAARQGYAVALSADGNTALTGGPADNTAVGAAWAWKRGVPAWGQAGKLVGTLALDDNNAQGQAVALSADGDTAIAGAPNESANGGAAWIFMGANCALDFDANGSIDAMTDGLLAVRAMQGLTGAALTNGVVGANATRSTPAALQAHLATRCGAGVAP